MVLLKSVLRGNIAADDKVLMGRRNLFLNRNLSEADNNFCYKLLTWMFNNIKVENLTDLYYTTLYLQKPSYSPKKLQYYHVQPS